MDLLTTHNILSASIPLEMIDIIRAQILSEKSV